VNHVISEKLFATLPLTGRLTGLLDSGATSARMRLQEAK
jgi:hypothetical protein